VHTHRLLASRSARLAVVAVVAALAAAWVAQGLLWNGSPASSAPRTPVAAPSGTVTDARTADADPSRRPRPNIVMIMADDMRTDDLRFMPTVRRLVQDRGLEFRNSFSPYPLCCPARASFLTGRYAHNHHVLSHESPWGFKSFDDSRTLATALQAGGYNTGFVGKYLNNYGFDPSLVTGGPSLRYVPAGWTDWHAGVEPPAGSGYSGGTYDYFHTVFNVNGEIEDTHAGRYQTGVLGDKARALVTKYAAEPKPFFLYLSSVAPHHGMPWESDDPAPVLRDDGGLTRFVTPARPEWAEGRFDATVTRPPGLPVDGGPSEADVSDKPRFMRHLPEVNAAERAAMVVVTRQRAESLLALDHQIGLLVGTLRETGELRNTVLMFTSDNGYFLGEHRQRQGKVKPHEPSLRVPFLAAGPGIPRGERRYDPVTTVDLTVTIADLAHARRFLPYPPDGSSRVPELLGGDQGWRVPVVTEGLVGWRAPGAGRRGFTDARTSIGIRTARYLFVRYANGDRELYDLDEDPNELRNVVGRPRYADEVRQLARIWRAYKDCVGPACTRPLPVALRTGPDRLARATEDQFRGWWLRYGG
jgi:N-acetylglucosamine-6-sulfatase